MIPAPDSTQLPPVWQQRFAFYRLHGQVGSTPEAQAAYKVLPFSAKLRLAFNIWAFLFGWLYFVVKGMWRKGLTVLALGLALGALCAALEVSDNVTVALAMGYNGMVATLANYAYYLEVAFRSQSWNPFEGFGRRQSD